MRAYQLTVALYLPTRLGGGSVVMRSEVRPLGSLRLSKQGGSNAGPVRAALVQG